MKCQQGDLAIIIESVDGASVGKIVQCSYIVGDHPDYGPTWRVTSKETLVTEYGGVGNLADVPDKWLRPIRPGELDKKTETSKLSESDLIKQVLKKAEKLNW